MLLRHSAIEPLNGLAKTEGSPSGEMRLKSEVVQVVSEFGRDAGRQHREQRGKLSIRSTPASKMKQAANFRRRQSKNNTENAVTFVIQLHNLEKLVTSGTLFDRLFVNAVTFITSFVSMSPLVLSANAIHLRWRLSR